MTTKGDRAAKSPMAERLYVDGHSLAEISRQLDVSDTTLRRWKSDSGVPGDEVDGWDRARQQKRGNIQRLKDLFERQLEYVEGLIPEGVTAPMMDTLSKLGALVERWDKIEKARIVAAEVVKEVRKSGLSDDAAEEIRRKI
ncbi:MAG: hypothetical protein JRC60_05660, partial [Deltaproteobacteria bacterium]|nr:hypothetical protein [Deltaproteobacteria bacterium]